MQYWEIIADDLSKAVGVRAVSQPRIIAGEHKARQIAAMMVKTFSITSSDVSTYLRHG